MSKKGGLLHDDKNRRLSANLVDQEELEEQAKEEEKGEEVSTGKCFFHPLFLLA